ncbi:peptidase [Sphaerospermopsis torques-reginae]|uniref:peptidase n=1 Tax=Sphaerospermopsis torques-reginae TaxID=984207 RepID=UPI001FEBA5BC|nr:peptidase [Sphaerospermopsis torques-reginae]
MGKISQKSICKTQNRNHQFFGWKLLTVLTLFIISGLLVILTNFHTYAKEPNPQPPSLLGKGAKISPILVGEGLGERSRQKPHPLPLSLEKWQDQNNSGDYFDHIQPTQVGYLIWSHFPIKVNIETPTNINQQQAQTWVNQVSQAIKEWNNFLPLELVENSEIADIKADIQPDIKILRQRPPLQIDPISKTPRARSALTTYELYNQNNFLLHRFTILLSPSQTGEHLQAAARHEMGHALGIWGHSPLKTDALYFSQVRKPASISSRDVNTLKKIYQQSTSLGWSSVKN